MSHDGSAPSLSSAISPFSTVAPGLGEQSSMTECSTQVKRAFADIATAIAHHSGRPITFLLAALIIIVWAVTGPIFRYSDTWQLIINTGTTIITFLMVFIIQNTQNRDG